DDYQARNLSFKTNIQELSIGAEFNLVDPQIYLQVPYVFAGIGVFHFNPFTYDNDGNKTYLKPLSTEGEGLSDYPARKNYSIIQLNFIFKVQTGQVKRLMIFCKYKRWFIPYSLKQGLNILFFCSCHQWLTAQNCPPNIDFETGTFNGWTCYLGTTAAVNGENI